MGRKKYSKELKAQIALDAIKGQKTIAELASEYGVHANQISIWKKQLLDAAPAAFSNGKDKDAAKLSADILMSKEFQNRHVMITGLELLKQKNLLKMIQEMSPNKVSIKMSEKHYTGHYEVTPYSFRPNVALKLVANPYIDLGQGLVECMRRVHHELSVENGD